MFVEFNITNYVERLFSLILFIALDLVIMTKNLSDPGELTHFWIIACTSTTI